jgi:Lrp/AsnC family leucine-responsive transcriptional regulator
MIKLTRAEQKVLSILEEDARTPASQIAKKARLSTEGVLKILDRLKAEGVILRFNSKMNYSRMGYTLIPVQVKLARRDRKTVSSIASFLKSKKVCTWFTFCEGEYDLLMSFRISDAKDRGEMDDALRSLAKYILSRDVALVLEAFEVGKSFIGGNRQVFKVTDHTVEPAALSSVDLHLIECLRSDARTPAIVLSKKVGVSARTVASRISWLRKEGIITGFKTKLSPAALGFQPCIALITFSSHDQKEEMRFLEWCRRKVSVNYLVRMIGAYDVELTLDTDGVQEFYQVIDEIRSEFLWVRKITTLIAKEHQT